MSDVTADQLLTARECAKVLRIGESTCYRLIQNGEIHSIRIGGSVRVPGASLLAFIEASYRAKPRAAEAS